MTTPSGANETVDLNSLRPGSLVDVETKNRHYSIECLGGSKIRISGHPQYCPVPMPAVLEGSVDREGAVELGHIERGRRLLFLVRGQGPVTTTTVVSVHVDQPKASQPKSSPSIH
jgi:hypothetical protein